MATIYFRTPTQEEIEMAGINEAFTVLDHIEIEEEDKKDE